MLECLNVFVTLFVTLRYAYWKPSKTVFSLQLLLINSFNF